MSRKFSAKFVIFAKKDIFYNIELTFLSIVLIANENISVHANMTNGEELANKGIQIISAMVDGLLYCPGAHCHMNAAHDGPPADGEPHCVEQLHQPCGVRCRLCLILGQFHEIFEPVVFLILTHLGHIIIW